MQGRINFSKFDPVNEVYANLKAAYPGPLPEQQAAAGDGQPLALVPVASEIGLPFLIEIPEQDPKIRSELERALRMGIHHANAKKQGYSELSNELVKTYPYLEQYQFLLQAAQEKGIKLLPVSTGSDSEFEADLNEIELFVKNGGKINPANNLFTIPYIINAQSQSSQRYTGRLEAQLNYLSILSRQAANQQAAQPQHEEGLLPQVAQLENLKPAVGLSTLCVERLNRMPASNRDWELSLQAEYDALKYRKPTHSQITGKKTPSTRTLFPGTRESKNARILKQTLDTIKSGPDYISPSTSPFRLITKTWAQQLLEYVNDREGSRGKWGSTTIDKERLKQKLERAGNLAHQLLHVKSMEDAYNALLTINQLLDDLQLPEGEHALNDARSKLVPILSGIRKQLVDIKANYPLAMTFRPLDATVNTNTVLNNLAALKNLVTKRIVSKNITTNQSYLREETYAPLRKRRRQRAHIEVVMSAETKQQYREYLEEIKYKTRFNVPPDGPLSFVGEALQKQLLIYAYEEGDALGIDVNDPKDVIAGMSVEEFIDCMFKTTQPTLFAEDSRQTGPWTEREYELLANSAKVLKDVTAFTAKTLYQVLEEKINSFKHFFLKDNQKPKTDLLFVNGPIIALTNPIDFKHVFDCDFNSEAAIKQIRKYNKSERTRDDYDELKLELLGGVEPREFFNQHFQYDKYKALLKQRLLPGIIAQNYAHKNGFILTMPAIGCSAFAWPFGELMKGHYERAFKELITDHAAQLTNLRAVVYTDGDKQFQDEAIPGTSIPFISTNAKIGTAPQPILEAFERKYPETSKLSQLGVVTLVAGDPLSHPLNDLNSGQTSTHEGGVANCTDAETKLTGQPGRLDEKSGNYLPDLDQAIEVAPGLDALDDVVQRELSVAEKQMKATEQDPTKWAHYLRGGSLQVGKISGISLEPSHDLRLEVNQDQDQEEREQEIEKGVLPAFLWVQGQLATIK